MNNEHPFINENDSNVQKALVYAQYRFAVVNAFAFKHLYEEIYDDDGVETVVYCDVVDEHMSDKMLSLIRSYPMFYGWAINFIPTLIGKTGNEAVDSLWNLILEPFGKYSQDQKVKLRELISNVVMTNRVLKQKLAQDIMNMT